ncbi:uncharacterized protein LOC133702880 [Populus nigra]|uniref:uncharacterized protein LOC133702880 n=1 Tax=Populus nigra TaxID=3691 RepID=UPI002B266BC1|nr:uncharacterized protein LOC133702880 [Populus nigra]
MDSPQRISIKEPQVILSPCSSRRRRASSDSNSPPEFEFWMVQNPSFPQPNLVTADELFVDGVLLPLYLLHHPNNNSNNNSNHPPDPDPDSTEPEPPSSQPDPEPEISPASITMEPTSSSKRWKDIIFKKGDKKTSTAAKKQEEKDKDKEKDKKREKRSQNGASSAELNINIWPFSRSRSEGNSVTRPKLFPGAPGTRKVSSAPCSRSNSAGESKSRKSWPSSPGRPGVHLSRSSPVWQVRRGGGSGTKSSFPEPVVRNGEKSSSKKEVTEPRRSKNTANVNGSTNGARAKVLNINVPVCIGYRNHLSCRSGVRGADGSDGGATKNAGGDCGGSSTTNVGNGGNLFNLRSLFTKKVY